MAYIALIFLARSNESNILPKHIINFDFCVKWASLRQRLL